MSEHQITRTILVAILVAMTAALVARSWLQVEFVQDGMNRAVAADLSYLLVPPTLVLLLFPLWQTEKVFFEHLFPRQNLSKSLVVRALAIGVLIRLTWWGQLIAGVSFGFYKSSQPDAVVGPVFSIQCEPAVNIILGLFVMAVLIPVIEETVHRGYIQTAMKQRGFIVAVASSALIFAVFHNITTWPFAFLAGLILGTQFWITRNLWASIITHATVNGMMQIDWRCVSGQWNPRSEDLPALQPGLLAVALTIFCVISLLAILKRMATEAQVPR